MRCSAAGKGGARDGDDDGSTAQEQRRALLHSDSSGSSSSSSSKGSARQARQQDSTQGKARRAGCCARDASDICPVNRGVSPAVAVAAALLAPCLAVRCPCCLSLSLTLPFARRRQQAMAERYNIYSQLEHLQSKYIGTGHSDTSKFEWLLNQHRDSFASYLGHHDLVSFFAIAENETKARIRFNLLHKMLQPCGPPPEKLDE